MEKVTASLLVVNWNGRRLLEENLPSVMRTAGDAAEVLLVDNGSEDGSVEYVRSSFPGVRVLVLDANAGSAGGLNAGAREARGPVVVTLAADIRVREDFLPPLLRHFQRPEVFAAAPKRLYPEGRVEVEELVCLFNRSGLFEQAQPGMGQPDGWRASVPCPTWYAPLAAGAFRRDRFLALGGFDPAFGPVAFWGEHDLGYRAWKRGWEVVYEPASVVWHLFGDQVRRRFSQQELEAMNWAGRFLLAWGNLTDPSLVARHRTCLPRLIAAAGACRDGFELALRHSDDMVSRLEADRRAQVRSDREVLGRIGGIMDD